MDLLQAGRVDVGVPILAMHYELEDEFTQTFITDGWRRELRPDPLVYLVLSVGTVSFEFYFENVDVVICFLAFR